MAHYARGVAFAATGKKADAETELTVVQKVAAAATGDSKRVFDIASHALLGEIAARNGDPDAAIAHFQEAKNLEDGILYYEPPTWYYPIRHSLGSVLLKANRPADAEGVYREDLKRFPENGWALFGLAQALRAEGKTAEAAQVDARFQKAWQGADVTLVASRF
jgi:tetratricopeptide (TPR) repeat protein